MRRLSLKLLVGLVVLVGGAWVALAADEAPAGAKDAAGARRPGLRHGAIMFLRNTEEGKAEVEQFKQVLEGLRAEHKTLREAIRKDIQGGKTPAEAIAAHKTEIEALMKKRIDAGIAHREKMLSIARNHEDELVAKWFERFQQAAPERWEKMKERWQQRHKGVEGTTPPAATTP